MAVTVSSFREYLRAAPDTTDAQLESWLAAARSEARTAGIPDFSHNAQYDLFIKALAAWYYDNRGFQVSGTYQATALGTKQKMVDSFVLQLRHATEDPVPDVPDTPTTEDDPPGDSENGGDDE